MHDVIERAGAEELAQGLGQKTPRGGHIIFEVLDGQLRLSLDLSLLSQEIILPSLTRGQGQGRAGRAPRQRRGRALPILLC